MAAALNRPSQKASALQNQANLFWIRGDYRNALSRQNDALALADSLKLVALQISGRSTLGLIHLSLGDAAKAMEAGSKALESAKSAGRSVDQATILKNMGLVEIREGRFGEAVGYFLQATTLDSAAGSKAGLASDYRNLGQAYIRMGRGREAVTLFRQGLDLSVQVGDRRNQIQCRYGLGQALAELGESESAIAVLDTGIEAASELGIPDLSWRLLRQRAMVRSAVNRKEAALEDIQSAVVTVEKMRAELKTDALKQGFLDDKMDLYVDAVKLLLDMNRPSEAFDFVERAKSRGFIDMLANQNLRLSEASGKRLEEEKAARLSIQEVQTRLSRLPADSAFIPEKTKWINLLAERRARYESLIDSIQTENPQLASFVSVDPWDAGRIQKMLPDSVVLIEYMATPKTLFVWAVSNNRITARTVEVAEADLRTQVQRFRETIQAYLSADLEGKSLYQGLFGPIEKELESARHVIIVPHGILHYLPFAALVDAQGRNPIDRFSLSFAPSATVWGWCAEKAARQTLGKDVLAIANPDLGDPKLSLPFAAKEVQALTRVYPFVQVYEAKAATKETVRQKIGSASIIHFACHGEYQPDSPLFSSLLLSPTSDDNGRLEAHEIFGLSLNCDLVTLSACETGLAKVTQGDEIIGLARSFIFAGAPSLITSLWKVDDLATAIMVKRFYRSLASGMPKAEALRRAQLVVRDAVNTQPAAWAAFGLTGNFE
jgi:CHAT domain-containing protein